MSCGSNEDTIDVNNGTVKERICRPKCQQGYKLNDANNICYQNCPASHPFTTRSFSRSGFGSRCYNSFGNSTTRNTSARSENTQPTLLQTVAV
jgi:hypothetical protein